MFAKLKQNKIIRSAAAALAVIAVAALLEAVVFNFRFFQTASFEPLSVFRIEYADLEKNPDGSFTPGENPEIVAYVNARIFNVYTDISSPDGPVGLRLFITDEANSEYLSLPSAPLNGEVERTKYRSVYTSGISEKIKIAVSTESDRIYIREIGFNRTVPYSFSPARFLTALAFLALAFGLRPTGKNYLSSPSRAFRRAALAIFAALLIALSAAACLLYPESDDFDRQSDEYERFAHALSSGQLYFEETPPDYLLEMENPYDTYAREKLAAETGEPYEWDVAFYEGRYYMYFGIVPELIFFLPYHLITGRDFPTALAAFLSVAAFVLIATALIGRLAKRYFEKAPFALVFTLLTAFFAMSGFCYMLRCPKLYTLPIVCGLDFAMLGLLFWLNAKKEGGALRPGMLLAGSLCMALVAGCRPQLVIAAFFAIPIFYEEIFKTRLLFSKKGLAATVAALAPFLAVAACIMYYNAARFGSPFDFGANYNLTTNDMTKRGFSLSRLPYAFFSYLFQPVALCAVFPFVTPAYSNTLYQGNLIWEQRYGGLLFQSPITLAAPFFGSAKAALKKRGIFALTAAMLAAGIILVAVDAQAAGVLMRYSLDYEWLFFLPAAFTLLALYDSSCGQPRVWIRRFAYAAALCAVVVSFFTFFAISHNVFYEQNSAFYDTARSLVHFWM